MTITFDKGAKQIVYNLLRPKVKNRDCPSCNEPVTAKNFGGAFHIDGVPRFVHRNFVCLLDMAEHFSTKYYHGWHWDAGLKGWRKYWRLFWIGWASETHGDDAAREQDEKFFRRWG